MNNRKHLIPILSLMLAFSIAIVLSINSPVFAKASTLPTYTEFSASLVGTEGLAGIYADQLFAYEVRKQPVNNVGFVSSEPDVVTEFTLASQYNTTGLLAHNTLAGAVFNQVQVGQTITLLYADGSAKLYEVMEIEQYQALTPESPRSDFVPLDNPTMRMSATELFNRIYAPGQRLVLQTCIEAGGNPSWGRLFIIARPKIISPLPSFAFDPFTWILGKSIKAQ